MRGLLPAALILGARRHHPSRTSRAAPLRIGGIQFAVAFGRDFAQLFHRALVNGTAFVGIAPIVPTVVQVRLGTVNGFSLTAAFQWWGIFVTVEIAQFALPLAVEIKPPADQGGYGNQ